MRIIVNDIAADEHSGGAFTVLQDFYQAIKKYGNEHEWVLLLAAPYFPETSNITILSYPEIKKSWLKRLNFDFFTGKNIIKALDGDVYFSLQNTALFGTDIPQVVYLHQPLPFQKEKKFSFFKANERKLAVYQHLFGILFKYSLKNAKKIIVQTNWMKTALIEKGTPPKTIEIIPPSLNIPNDKREIAQPKNNQFFYPAADYIYKNHQLLFEAATILKQRGLTDFTILCTLDPQKRENYPASDHIQFTGKLSLSNVYHYYQTAILVFPSYIETFGLPLLEARTFQTIILAANTSFAQEILSGYTQAYFFNYQDAHALADLMEQCLTKTITSSTNNSIENSANLQTDTWKKVIQTITQAK